MYMNIIDTLLYMNMQYMIFIDTTVYEYDTTVYEMQHDIY